MTINFKKCDICKNVVWTFNDSDIKCCDSSMRLLKPNSVDAAFEKHVPEYEVVDNKINIKVNHVMEDVHYIMWLMYVTDDKMLYKEFKPSEIPEVTFDYLGKGVIYSYCNLHELWSKEVE